MIIKSGATVAPVIVPPKGFLGWDLSSRQVVGEYLETNVLLSGNAAPKQVYPTTGQGTYFPKGWISVETQVGPAGSNNYAMMFFQNHFLFQTPNGSGGWTSIGDGIECWETNVGLRTMKNIITQPLYNNYNNMGRVYVILNGGGSTVFPSLTIRVVHYDNIIGV